MSAARQLPNRDYRPAPATKPTPPPRRRQRGVFVQDTQVKHRHNILSYFTLIALFVAIITFMMLHADFSYANRQLENASAQLASLQQSNLARETELYASLDLAQIEHYAITVLGMAPAESFQRVEITAPRQPVVLEGLGVVHTQNTISFSRLFSSIFGR